MKNTLLILCCTVLAFLSIISLANAQDGDPPSGRGGGYKPPEPSDFQKHFGPLPRNGDGKHTSGDTLRDPLGGFDTRTESGRAEIEWLERRFSGELHLALSEYYISDISVDLVTRTAIIVFDSMIELTESLRKKVTDSVVFFTGFDAARVVIVNDRPF